VAGEDVDAEGVTPDRDDARASRLSRGLGWLMSRNQAVQREQLFKTI
jgi:hypothetical protein